MATAISPYHYDVDFPDELTLDQKIDVFVARVQGWQLEPAQRLINIDIHAGFAALHILISYFESIAQFYKGESSKGKSKEYFKFGFKDVFPNTNFGEKIPEVLYDELLDELYESLRCGLYHNALAHSNVYISGEYKHTIAFASDNTLHINPSLLPQNLRMHLHAYARKLRHSSPEYDHLRRCFEKTFDGLSEDKAPKKVKHK